MSRVRAALCAIAIVSVGGCYHITVVTGAPASAQTIDKQWQNSFVYGLVPPSELNSKDTCTQGVAKVETERSFLNSLVGAITYSIYTPLHATITCASGPVAR
jgi:Bor protein